MKKVCLTHTPDKGLNLRKRMLTLDPRLDEVAFRGSKYRGRKKKPAEESSGGKEYARGKKRWLSPK